MDQQSSADLEKLTQNSNALGLFLNENKVQLFSSTVATVPARKDVQWLVINDKYETYKSGDFARLGIQLSNEIESSPEGPISTVSLSVFPKTDSDEKMMKVIAQDDLLRVEIAAIEPTSPYVEELVRWSGRLNTEKLQKVLMRYPAKNLKFAVVMVKIAASQSDFTFASVPARILVPSGP